MSLFQNEEIVALLRLLFAHILGDFVFQSASWVTDKKEKGLRSPAFYKHLAVVGVLTFLAIGKFTSLGLGITLIITITHGAIDYWKIRTDKNDTLFYFIADQLLHLVVLIMAWLLLTHGFHKAWGTLENLWNSFPVLLISLGYLFCIVPSSYIVKYATRQMISQDQESNVKRGGRLIGIFERLIIFTFMLFSQYEAIGFLITGKSILRFSDGQKKETEYVLVGTMISYALAILAGVLVNLLRQS
jgi:hypothetical protein